MTRRPRARVVLQRRLTKFSCDNCRRPQASEIAYARVPCNDLAVYTAGSSVVQGLLVVYGECLDGGSLASASAKATLGQVAVGPAGLLDLIETFTGLAAPPIPAARRIAQMESKLAVFAKGAPFWSASFCVDPWAVAREVLRLRDGLVEAGWTGTSIPSATGRIADLATLEAMAEPPLLPGRPDRILEAIKALGQGLQLPFQQVRVVDPPGAVGPGIARLLQAMDQAGVEITYQSADVGAGRPGTDLARAQAWLLGGQREPLQGDGTLVILNGRSEAAQAEAVADWLATGLDASDTAVILGSPTGILDGAMLRRRLPRFAHLQASPLRGAVQVLSLAFSSRWRPFRPEALLDLLSVPHSPIPGDLGRELALALTEAPGRNGPRWLEAIEKGQQRRVERFKNSGLSGAELTKRVERDSARWRPWLEGVQFEESPGISANVAREICGQVAAWAARIGARGGDAVAAAGRFASTLSVVIAEAGVDPIPRVQLERMIDSVVAEGVDQEHLSAEASPWSHVFHPAQITDDVGTVIWWGFKSDPALHGAIDWTDEEISALMAAGIAPEGPELKLRREAAAARRAITRATDRALLVVPPGSGDELDVHPLLHELAPIVPQATRGVYFSAERLFESQEVDLAGRHLNRTLTERRRLPVPRRSWLVSTGKIQPRPVETATSIELLLGCPFAWSLRYFGKLRPARRSEIPEGEQLLGLLAHALAAEIFQPGPPPSPKQALENARKRLPALIEEMAAPLRLPGAAADYVRALSRMPAAMQSLARALEKLGATVIAAEVEHEKSDVLGSGVSLSGRIDLLIKDQEHRPAIIDMKWSRTDRYRRDEIQQGHAVQLAVYGRLAGSNAEPAPAAYFMLSQARLLPAGNNLFGPAVGGTAPDLSDVWSHASSSWRERMNALGRGNLTALSSNLVADHEPSLEENVPTQLSPPCRFCDKTLLCGHARVL